MSKGIRATFDSDDLVQRYLAGESIISLEKRFHTKRPRIKAVLAEHGVVPRGRLEALRLATVKPVDSEQIVSRYLAGESMHTLGKSFGVDRCIIRRVLMEHSVVPRNQESAAHMLRRVHFDEAAAVERYLGGESLNSLSAAYGVYERAVARAVTKRGIKLRTIGEANNLFHDQITTEQRRERATKHTVTWEGRSYPRIGTASPESMRRRALTCQSNLAYQKPDEIEVLGLLPRGWVEGQQVAVDRYNIDFTHGAVAVEIYSMGLHPFRTEQTVSRAIDLAERGWHVIYFWLNKSVGNRRVSAEGIAELVARAEFLDRDPSAGRQYLVIRGRGEIVTAGRFDTEQRTLVAAAVDTPETADRHDPRIAG